MQISGIAEGTGKGRIPWARIKAAQGDFILPQYLPDGITLTQYHHIQLNDANALLQHWTQCSGITPRYDKPSLKVG